jgi:hypothetical protein
MEDHIEALDAATAASSGQEPKGEAKETINAAFCEILDVIEKSHDRYILDWMADWEADAWPPPKSPEVKKGKKPKK